MLFGGNLLRQPAFIQLMKDKPKSIRLTANYKGADEIMNDTFFLGTYPGLTQKMLETEISVISKFVKQKTNDL